METGSILFCVFKMRVVIESESKDVLRFTAETIVNRIHNYIPTNNQPFTLVLPNPGPSTQYL